MSTSPTERMFGRSTRSILPSCNPNKTVSTDLVLREKLKKKLTSQANYNRSAKDMDSLIIGSPVLLRDFSASKGKWMSGKVVEQLSDRSYTVLNNETGNIVRRNRVDLRSGPLSLNGPSTRGVDTFSTAIPVSETVSVPDPIVPDTIVPDTLVPDTIVAPEQDASSRDVPERNMSTPETPQPAQAARRNASRASRRLPVKYQIYDMK